MISDNTPLILTRWFGYLELLSPSLLHLHIHTRWFGCLSFLKVTHYYTAYMLDVYITFLIIKRNIQTKHHKRHIQTSIHSNQEKCKHLHLAAVQIRGEPIRIVLTKRTQKQLWFQMRGWEITCRKTTKLVQDVVLEILNVIFITKI